MHARDQLDVTQRPPKSPQRTDFFLSLGIFSSLYRVLGICPPCLLVPEDSLSLDGKRGNVKHRSDFDS